MLALLPAITWFGHLAAASETPHGTIGDATAARMSTRDGRHATFSDVQACTRPDGGRDRGGHNNVDDRTERRPPAGVVDVPGPVLPEVLCAVARESGHQDPRRASDPCTGD